MTYVFVRPVGAGASIANEYDIEAYRVPVACAVQPEAELSRYGFSSFASLELESEPGVLKYLRCTTTAVND